MEKNLKKNVYIYAIHTHTHTHTHICYIAETNTTF